MFTSSGGVQFNGSPDTAVDYRFGGGRAGPGIFRCLYQSLCVQARMMLCAIASETYVIVLSCTQASVQRPSSLHYLAVNFAVLLIQPLHALHGPARPRKYTGVSVRLRLENSSFCTIT